VEISSSDGSLGSDEEVHEIMIMTEIVRKLMCLGADDTVENYEGQSIRDMNESIYEWMDKHDVFDIVRRGTKDSNDKDRGQRKKTENGEGHDEEVIPWEDFVIDVD
jgi:hypothetical protein